MRIRLSLVIAVVACILPIALNASPHIRTTDKLVLTFFGSSTCGECLEIKETILKPLAAANPKTIDLRLLDTEDTASFNLMVKLEKLYGVTAPSPQELFFPDTFLIGFEQITAHARAFTNARLANPDTWYERIVDTDTTTASGALRERLERFTFWGILVAGLIDGINPCAIATMIF